MVKTRSKAQKKPQEATPGLPPKSPATTFRPPPPKTPVSRPRREDDSVSSADTTSSSSTAIAKHILKQLAKDIEAKGGIKAFAKDSKSNLSLSNLCDLRTESFSQRGDLLRSKITKKVYRWQLLDKEGKYDSKVLNLLQVKSFATLQAEQRQQELPTKKQATKKQATKKQAPKEQVSRADGEDSLSFCSDSSNNSSSISSTTAAPSIRSKFEDIPFSPPPPVVVRTRPQEAPIMSATRPRSPQNSIALPRGAGE
jgi:hypothetical protein